MSRKCLSAHVAKRSAERRSQRSDPTEQSYAPAARFTRSRVAACAARSGKMYKSTSRSTTASTSVDTSMGWFIVPPRVVESQKPECEPATRWRMVSPNDKWFNCTEYCLRTHVIRVKEQNDTHFL